ncbi:hypothetical protein FAGAP_3013 [Fusarium agapanthi]|uniref:Uncharacterized protein n=1 Tax=Fusarium agapanthi TaxID=1803897 RepID=A0A9P5BEV6_9HYPO|nr:hypothetical protein FAGAP_3013 [Fusarium agapanthi]
MTFRPRLGPAVVANVPLLSEDGIDMSDLNSISQFMLECNEQIRYHVKSAVEYEIKLKRYELELQSLNSGGGIGGQGHGQIGYGRVDAGGGGRKTELIWAMTIATMMICLSNRGKDEIALHSVIGVVLFLHVFDDPVLGVAALFAQGHNSLTRMAGQVKAKDKSDDYHSDSESKADDLSFTGVCRSERARQLRRLIAHLEQADSSGHAEVIRKLKEKKSWDGRKGNVIAWITNNITNWNETMVEGEKKRLIDEGNLLMEESSKRGLKLAKEPKMTHLEGATETSAAIVSGQASQDIGHTLKRHAADNKDLPTQDDLPQAGDELAGSLEMSRFEDTTETSVDTASDQTTEENDLSQTDKLSERGIIKAIFPQVYEQTEPSQPVAQTGHPEHIVGAHENSKRKNKPTTSLNQQDHELPPTTEVSKTNEASRHVTQFTPEGIREIQRVWNRFRDYRARQIMLRSALNQQDDQHSPPLKRIHSDPALNEFANWFPQRQALRERDERIARQRGYGIQ